jgi:type I restriction enzyme, S subunit
MIPEGWDTYELGDLAEFKSGGTPSKQNDSYWGGAFPWVSAKDLKSHLITKAELGLTASGELQANVAPIESILVLVRGMTLLKDVPIGLVKRRVAFNQDIKALITNAHVDPLFLSYFLVLQKKTMMALVNTANHGTGRLDTELLRGLMILLPPLPEQRRIADILSTWDRAIETVNALITNTRAQKKALMQSLLTGKHRLPGFSGQWTEKSLDELFTFRRGQGLSKAAVTPDGIRPCILYGELYTRYPEVIESVVGRTNSNEGFYSKVGDVLIPASTTTTGIDLANATALLESDVLLSGDINVLRTKDIKQSAPFFAYLLTHTMKYKIASRAQGITIIHLYGSDLKPLKVLVPEPDEQHAIADVIMAADKKIGGLQSQLKAIRQEKSALMQQLLTGKRRVKMAESEAA